jgi:putative transcriptional regulator
LKGAGQMNPTVASRIRQRLEEFTVALESGKPIQDTFTCRRVQLDLKPTQYDPRNVKQTRKMLKASQAVFAMFLGTSTKTVQAWEQGLCVPSKMACRFMDEIRRNPGYWIRRLSESIVQV